MKKFFLGILVVALIFMPIGQVVGAKSINEPKTNSEYPMLEIGKYETHFELDLSNLNLDVKDDKINITELSISENDKSINEKIKRRNFTKDIIQNKILNNELKTIKFNEHLKNLLIDTKKKDGKLLGVGITIVNFKKSLDSDGKEILTPMENSLDMVSALDQYETGTPSYNADNTCSLWTSATTYSSMPGYVYPQSHLYWSVCPNEGGRDFIGVSWQKDWSMTNSYGIDISTCLGGTSTTWPRPSYCDNSSHSIAWSFDDVIDLGTGLHDYVEAVVCGVFLTAGPTGYQNFYSKYTHTYASLSYSLNISSTPTTGFSVSPTYFQYSVASHLGCYIY